MSRGEEEAHKFRRISGSKVYGDQVSDVLRAVVIEDYVPTGEGLGSQLELEVDDVVWVYERHQSGWWGGHKDGEDIMAWFPGANVRITGYGQYEEDSDDEGASPNDRGHDALRTSDRRVVASPQVGRQIGPDDEQLQARLAAAFKAQKHAETELAAEQRRHRDTADRAERAEAKSQQLRREQANMAAEHERKLTQLAAERQQWERRMKDMEQMRAQDEKRAHDLEVKVSRMAEELRKKEADAARQKAQLEEALAATTSRAERAEQLQQQHQAPLQPPQPPQPQHLAPHSVQHAVTALSQPSYQPPTSHQHPVAAGRAPSTDVSRRLFSGPRPPSHEHPVACGARTPPPPSTSCTGPGAPLAGGSPAATAPVIPSVTAVPSVGSMQALGSARRPPPRSATASASAPGLQCWPSTSSSHATATSPQLQRPFPHCDSRDSADSAQVRAIITDFERRSSSQAPRAVDPAPPGRQHPQIFFTAPHTAMHARPSGTSNSRAGSREAPPGGRTPGAGGLAARMPARAQLADDGLPALGKGDDQSVNLGMSPLARQVHHTVTGGRAAGVVSSSPSAQPSVSVQDRIRQLNTHSAAGANRFFR